MSGADGAADGVVPFVMLGGDAALCEGEACALPDDAPQPDRHSGTESVLDTADSVPE